MYQFSGPIKCESPPVNLHLVGSYSYFVSFLTFNIV